MSTTTFTPFQGGTFTFGCHEKISCFNKCCAKLRLVLTPYDIIRMRSRLHISSGRFLDLHTETVNEPGARFPMVRLTMSDNEAQSCPFVTPAGCSIYEDRPGACRIYPVGRAATIVSGEKDARAEYFMVREPHCMGFREPLRWTMDEWLSHEGVAEYNAMNDQWLEILTSRKSLGDGRHAASKLRMFFMASYNPDAFRKFLFESSFFDQFQIEPELRARLADDDVELLTFAVRWLRFSLFGEHTLRTKNPHR